MEDVRQRLGDMGLSGVTMEQLSEVEWKLGEIKVCVLIKGTEKQLVVYTKYKIQTDIRTVNRDCCVYYPSYLVHGEG